MDNFHHDCYKRAQPVDTTGYGWFAINRNGGRRI